MSTVLVYAQGETTGSSFHLVSKWSSGTTPTTGYATFTYPIDQPAGAKIKSIIAYAEVGSRFWPISGVADEYPRANDVPMTKVSDHLYSAPIEFSDNTITTKVTYSFRANGNTTNREGALSFDNVHLLVDYTPPCSSWHLANTSYELGEAIQGYITINGDNADYSHEVHVAFGNNLVYDQPLNSGVNSFTIPVAKEWSQYFPYSPSGSCVLTLHTFSADGQLLGSSEGITVSISANALVAPTIGTVSVETINPYKEMALQSVSGFYALGSGWSGLYGAQIASVSLIGYGKSTIINPRTDENLHYIELRTGTINIAGNSYIRYTVTDTRGISSSTSVACSVAAYSPIEIMSVSQERINSGDDSDSWQACVSYVRTDLGQDVTLTTAWHATNDISIGNEQSTNNYASGQMVSFTDTAYRLQKDLPYQVTYTLSDGISVAKTTRAIGSSFAFMRWEPKNNAIGFGCYPTGKNRVQIGDNWDLVCSNYLTSNEDGELVPLLDGKLDKHQPQSNVGTLFYVGSDGVVSSLVLGAGLSITNGVLNVTGSQGDNQGGTGGTGDHECEDGTYFYVDSYENGFLCGTGMLGLIVDEEQNASLHEIVYKDLTADDVSDIWNSIDVT